jgi:hypothetical protein
MRRKCQRHRGLSGYPRMRDCAGPLTFCSHLEKPITLRSLANPPDVGHVDLFPPPFTAYLDSSQLLRFHLLHIGRRTLLSHRSCAANRTPSVFLGAICLQSRDRRPTILECCYFARENVLVGGKATWTLPTLRCKRLVMFYAMRSPPWNITLRACITVAMVLQIQCPTCTF